MRTEAKRAYEKAAKDDGYRVLVDRLWPRGVSKAKAKIDLWAKEPAPSAKLRAWFHADPDKRFEEFSKKYAAELKGSAALKDLKKELKGKARVTLVTAVKDIEHSHVPTLLKFLK
jgi:uncharacterized protein YeaO (DUF488 family)